MYSEFTDRFTTCYRISRSPDGPWTAPAHDSIDGRGLYAAKSAPWSGRRLFFGWIASRLGERDDGEWLWAGTMAALEAVPREDGSLRLRIPPEVLDRYGRAAWSLPAPVTVGDAASYRSRVLSADLPADARVSADLHWAPGTREISLLVRTNADGETGYSLRLKPVFSAST